MCPPFPASWQKAIRPCYHVSIRPLRSRKAGFPGSGSDLGICPPTAFPLLMKLKWQCISAPLSHGLHYRIRPILRLRVTQFRARDPTKTIQVPRAPSHAYLHRSYGLMRQTKTLLPPSQPIRQVFAACRHSLLRDGPSD